MFLVYSYFTYKTAKHHIQHYIILIQSKKHLKIAHNL